MSGALANGTIYPTGDGPVVMRVTGGEGAESRGESYIAFGAP